MSEGTDAAQRQRPNILITGTPCTGKTATATLLAERTGMKHVSVGDLIKEGKYYDGKDEELDSFIVDEDKLLDAMEAMLLTATQEGEGVVVDYHSCELFPERWFDLILVLRAKTEVLFDRLTQRGYSERKRSENMECEIMQIVLDEAREAYAKDIVHELPSNTIEEMDSNIQRAQAWCEQWIADNET